MRQSGGFEGDFALKILVLPCSAFKSRTTACVWREDSRSCRGRLGLIFQHGVGLDGGASSARSGGCLSVLGFESPAAAIALARTAFALRSMTNSNRISDPMRREHREKWERRDFQRSAVASCSFYQACGFANFWFHFRRLQPNPELGTRTRNLESLQADQRAQVLIELTLQSQELLVAFLQAGQRVRLGGESCASGIKTLICSCPAWPTVAANADIFQQRCRGP